jgi:transcriptional regulator with XRE-family HTH domain
MKRLNRDTVQAKMREQGLSLRALAKRLDVSPQAASKWLKDESFPRPAILLKLAKTLSLSFSEITLNDAEPVGQFAFRTNKNHAITAERNGKAEDMMSALSALSSFASFDSHFSPATLAAPKNDYDYLQDVVRELRRAMGCTQIAPARESEIIAYFKKYSTVFIPVLWGKTGDNALHVSLTGSPVHFIYLNLQKSVADFKYWLLHELGHILTPRLSGDEAEMFSESFASTFLYPRELASALHDRLVGLHDVQAQKNAIVDEASAHMISPITVFQQVNAFAADSGKSSFDFNIFPVNTNYMKTVKLVSDVLFEEDEPTVEKYLAVTSEYFGSDFWDALSMWIRAQHITPGVVQRILDIPMSDAKGVFEKLALEKNPA